jgi:DNA-binding response OmpR family regulator
VRTHQSGTLQTILVIEDYADSRDMLRLLLNDLGYHVITAGDGRQALAVAAGEHVDLVLADLGLPDMSGLAVVRRLRKLTGNVDVPIIMLTAFDSSESFRSAMDVGCTAVFKKPLDFDNLHAMIDRLLSKPADAHSRIACDSSNL